MTITETTHRVNYSETDQMGIVYHAAYAVWLDVARTEHLRQCGLPYADIEARGFFLVVGELHLRYMRPARFDDVIRVRCWVRALDSRRVTFGYAVERAVDGELLVSGYTPMFVLDAAFKVARLPRDVAAILQPIDDPIRL